MASYYSYRPDSNQFAGIGFTLPDDQRIVDVHSVDDSLAGHWVAPLAHVFADNPESEGDFPSLSNYRRVPVLSKRAWDALRPLVGSSCEVLPILYPRGAEYYILHVMDTVDCLDYDKSIFTRNAATGRVSRISCYAFHENMLKGKHIFKLPLESGGELIVDDSFRRAVDQNGLRGLRFTELRRTMQ